MSSDERRGEAASQLERAYRHIRRAILRGDLQPGERLPVADLQARLGLGLTPIREALMRLGSEGLLTIEAHRGARVAELSLDGLADLMRTRREIEALCLRASIAAGDAEWEARVVAAMHVLTLPPRPERDDEEGLFDWEANHRRFHHALVSACGSAWLLRFWNTLADHSELHRSIRLLRRTEAGAGVRDIDGEHRALMEAALARDTDRALALMNDHMRATEAAMRRLVGAAARTETD